MRPIKFRAWNKYDERWCTSSELEWCILPNPIARNGNGIFELDESNEEKDSAFNLGTSYDLMQFTNLHDRTGKEIFEGDIFDPHIKGFGPCVVRFNRGAFVFEEDGEEYALGPIHSTGEVIGHIHEADRPEEDEPLTCGCDGFYLLTGAHRPGCRADD